MPLSSSLPLAWKRSQKQNTGVWKGAEKGREGEEKQHLVSDGRRERSPPHGISHHRDHGDADAGVKEAPYGEEGKKSFGPPPPPGGGEKEGKRGSSVPDDTSDDEEVEVADGASSYKVCNMT